MAHNQPLIPPDPPRPPKTLFVCQSCGTPLQGILTPQAKEIWDKMKDTGMVMLCEKCTKLMIEDMIKTLEIYGYTVTKTPKVKLV